MDPTANDAARRRPEPHAARRRPAREAATRARLDAREWSRTTPAYHALDLSFAVRTTSDAVADYLELVLEPLRTDSGSDAAHVFSVLDAGTRVGNRYAVYFDGQPVVRTPSEPQALEYVLWQLNRAAVEVSDRYLLLHAGAVAIDGRAVLFPAPMNSGKSTLVAGLVGRGLAYLSDEIAALDPDTGVVAPYPRPLSVDRGSWEVLAELQPQLHAQLEVFVDQQWHVTPGRIRADAVGAPSRPALVVGIQYEGCASTKVEPITRGAGVVLMAENAFNFGSRDRDDLRLLADIVAGCDCFRMTSGSLESACDEILRLAEHIAARS